MSDPRVADVPPPPHALAYAAPPMARPRITYRGAVTTVVVGAGFLFLTVAFIGIAAWLFWLHEQASSSRWSSLEPLGIFVCVLSGISFIVGTVIVFLGLKGVRQREMTV